MPSGRSSKSSGEPKDCYLTSPHFSLDDLIFQRLTKFPSVQIPQEVSNQLVVLIGGASADMTSDEAVGCSPEGMLGRERFRIHHVEIGSPQPPRVQRVNESLLIHRGTATDIVESGSGFELGKSSSIDKFSGRQ